MENLTNAQILGMEAGREMDALVGEKVMGYPHMHLDKDTVCPYCLSQMRYCGARSWCSDCHEWRYSPYKEYSDDIAAAWEVVEKLQDEEMFWEAENDFPEDIDCAVSYDFRIIHNGIDYESIQQISLPLAICRAALLATLELEPQNAG